MTGFKVGDAVLVVEGTWGKKPGKPIPGEVVKVGRTNMTVKWGKWSSSTFKMEDGIENTRSAREYPQGASHVCTLDQWAEKESRDAALERLWNHQHGRRGVLTPGGLRRITTDNAIRLADLLDEITPEED